MQRVWTLGVIHKQTTEGPHGSEPLAPQRIRYTQSKTNNDTVEELENTRRKRTAPYETDNDKQNVMMAS